MKRSWSKSSSSSDKICFALASGITLVLFAVMYACNYVTYTTTDDVALMQRLAGCFNNEPMTWGSYMSPLLTWFIAQLYRLFPNVPCYPYLQIFVMYVSITVINYCILRKFAVHAGGIWKALTLIVCVFATTLGFMLVRMHFYYASLLPGTAAVALILTDTYQGRKGILSAISTLLLIFVCICYSLDCSYAVLCFVALAVAYRFVMEMLDGRGRRAFFLAGICVLIVAVMLLGGKKLYQSERVRVNGEDYVQWNSYRVSYWDYEVVPYQEDPERYENVGWSEEFYNLTRKLYFMDEKFQTEELSQLVNKFSRTDFAVEPRTLRDTLKTGKDLFDSSRLAASLLFVCIGLYCATVISVRWDKKQVIRVIASTCSVAGSFILCFYLCYRGRFPLRAFATIAVPCAVFLSLNFIDIVFALKRDKDYESEEKPFKAGAKKLCSCLVYILVLGCGFGMSLNKTVDYLSDETLETYYKNCWNVEQIVYDYVSEHKDNLYIFDWTMLSTYDPFSNVSCGDLSNLFCWGGARLHTYAYREQLKLNGRENLYSDAFQEDNVYLLTNSTKNLQTLFSYLYSEYGMDTCIVTEELGANIVVVKFFRGVDLDTVKAMNSVEMWTYLEDD